MNIFLRICFTILITSLSLSSFANPCDNGGIGGTGIEINRSIGETGFTAASSGVGGTGISSVSEGIGGTGIQSQGGLGGTGIQAQGGLGGTGIVGVITGFGSICVNGLEVHFFSDTPVDLDGKKISSHALTIGQVVTVKANGTEESLVANEIHAYHQITGPITLVNFANGQLKVMGQSVNVNAALLKGMQVGQWVNVSGLRNENGSVTATRIDPTTVQNSAQIIGNLTFQENKFFMGGTLIVGLPKAAANSNTDTRLTGVWDGNSFKVKDFKLGPVSELLQKVEVFHIQGIASSNVSNGHIILSGQRVQITGQTRLPGNNSINFLTGKSVIVRGQMKDGNPTAQAIELQLDKSEHKNQPAPLVKPLQNKPSSDSGGKSSVRERDSHETAIPNTIDKADHIDKVDRVDKVERPERPDLPEKPSLPERPELPEKPQLPEKPG